MSVFVSLGRVVEELDRARLAYMVVGSVASSVHGRSRTTLDVDLVIEADADALERLLGELREEDWYFDAETARRALRERRQFNLIDQKTMWKVDLIVQKPSSYAATAFRRRVVVRTAGLEVWVQSAEDSVLSKLLWSRRSPSERQQRDIAGVLEASELDWEYLEVWAEELGVAEMLDELR
ncbi:MAG TPA: DUF6036 family nucleotidyltransferase [Myxococcota bacterium]|nr:DUF6036 family nucleotidyltransferase [Myxococcota bacterium]